MSILTVEHLSHGFGDRAIFDDVSFRLLKGEHIGLIALTARASLHLSILSRGNSCPIAVILPGLSMVRVGYMDQHAVLAKGQTVRDVLNSAFQYLYDIETEIGELYMKMGEVSEEEMNALLEEVGELQEILNTNDFYIIDSKVEEVARSLGLTDIRLDRDVSELSGRTEDENFAWANFYAKAGYFAP